MPRVVHPLAEHEDTALEDVFYHIVAWNYNLPSFDPLPTLKTVFLSPNSVKKFDCFIHMMIPFLGPIISIALAIRFATFMAPANVGRILAPISVFLHSIGMITACAQLRTKYAKLIICTFDFWLIFSVNTLWAIVLSATMCDLRVILVVFCWVNFTGWLFQETYLQNSYAVVLVALFEWLFYAMFTGAIGLELVDEVHHFNLVLTKGCELTTKDVLVNVGGTMTLMSLRNLWRRYEQVSHQKIKTGKSVKAPGYRSKISLSPLKPLVISLCNGVVPLDTSRRKASSSERRLLRLSLRAEVERFDSKDTLWRRIGSLNPIESWKTRVLYSCGAFGSVCAALEIFTQSESFEMNGVALLGLLVSSVFCGVFACCCQRRLLKRILTSFHFLFLYSQISAIALCLGDMFQWRWIPICSLSTMMLVAFTGLTIDALTPNMKRRLRFRFWMINIVILIYLAVLINLLLDITVFNRYGLQDRVFMTFNLFGRQSKYYVASTLIGRLLNVFIWGGRFLYVALTRIDDNALILLRGDVEIDFEGWRKKLHDRDE